MSSPRPTPSGSHPLTLSVAGKEVARYVDGTEMDPALSPRPYLHPVRTLAGVVLTEIEPADHRHHYGMSNAVADIDGTTYWGGKSYVHPDGYTMLANQGCQRSRQIRTGTATITESLEWIDADGAPHLGEDRHLRAEHLPAHHGWALHWHSVLRATGGDLALGSPATRGRTGAGYGGLFWRLSAASIRTEVRVAEGAGEEAALGSRCRWLMLSQVRAGAPVSLLLIQPDEVVPWFVRTSGYVGAGPAVAWSEHRHVPAGSSHRMSMIAVLADRALTTDDATTLTQRLSESPNQIPEEST